MRSKFKIFGNPNRTQRVKVPLLVIAIVAVIGFSIASCGDVYSDSDGSSIKVINASNYRINVTVCVANSSTGSLGDIRVTSDSIGAGEERTLRVTPDRNYYIAVTDTSDYVYRSNSFLLEKGTKVTITFNGLYFY